MPTLELAVFEVKDAEEFAGRHAGLHAQLSALFKGYVSSIGLRSATEPEVFADVVVWESTRSAMAAAEAMQTAEDLAWFRDELGPIRFFDHFEPLDEVERLDELASGSVVELVLVRPSDPHAFATAQAQLHAEHLADADTVTAHLRLARNENGIAGDVNGWTSAGAMEAMGPAMMELPELASVFDDDNEVVLFMPFAASLQR